MARIIVIDDDEQIRDMLRIVLERAGYKVTTATNGDEGLKVQENEKADLVITDILMPVQEGIGTIYELRHNHPEVKIIAISGGGGYGTPSHYVDMAKKIGAHRVFMKPFDTQQMLDTVGELLGKTSFQPPARRNSVTS